MRSDSLPTVLADASPPAPAAEMPHTVANGVAAHGQTVDAAAAGKPLQERASMGEGLPGDVQASEAAARKAEAMDSYRQALVRNARLFRRYPALARERGWEGTVTLSLHWHPGHSQPGIRLSRSGGHDVLDAAALEMLRQAVARTPLPAALEGQAFSLELPVAFNLEQP